MNQKIFITGGAGFVGSNLSILIKKNYPDVQVIAMDNLKRRGSELNIQRLNDAKVEFIHGDIRNKEDLDSVGGFDLMIECSAEPSVLAGYLESPEYVVNTNMVGTIHCLESARKNRADIIFLSTSRVYPVELLNSIDLFETKTRLKPKETQTIPGVSINGISEEFSIVGNRSLYGTTKLASEFFLSEYIDLYRIRGVINRCGIITGPWQMGKVDQGVVVLWVASHIYHNELAYIGYGGSGKQVRDILHVADLYRLIDFQMNHMDQINSGIFNVGGGNDISISLCELTAYCRNITGEDIQIKSVMEDRRGDIPYYISDTAKVTRETGWTPEITVTETIREITAWIQDNKKELKSILSDGGS